MYKRFAAILVVSNVTSIKELGIPVSASFGSYSSAGSEG